MSEKIISLNTEIENFGETLIANEALRQVIKPKLSPERRIKEILFHFKEGNLDQANDLHTIEQLVTEAENIKSEISNFKNTLRANPALSAVILPQLDIRIKRRDELLSVISLKQNSEFMKISVEKMDEVKYLLDQKISNLEVSLASNSLLQSELIKQVQLIQEKLDEEDLKNPPVTNNLPNLKVKSIQNWSRPTIL